MHQAHRSQNQSYYENITFVALTRKNPRGFHSSYQKISIEDNLLLFNESTLTKP